MNENRMSVEDYRQMISGKPSKKKSKYNNVKVDFNGIKFDSKREQERYCDLKMMENAKEITAFQHQVPFTLEGSTYIADFVYFDYQTKTFIVEDTKGFRTQVYKMKKKAMFERYGIKIKES